MRGGMALARSLALKAAAPSSPHPHTISRLPFLLRVLEALRLAAEREGVMERVAASDLLRLGLRLRVGVFEGVDGLLPLLRVPDGVRVTAEVCVPVAEPVMEAEAALL